MIFNIDDSGGMSAGMIGYSDPDALLYAASGSSWEAALLASGTLTVQRSCLVDLFLVAGGQPGSRGSGDATGGAGGAGGECVLVSSVWLRRGVSYAVTVGGSGEDTSIVGMGLSESAESGQGSAGGLGAIVTGLSRTRAASAGTDGVYAYSEDSDTTLISDLTGKKYGAGGGGADAFNSSYVYANSTSHGGSNAGGQTGGGSGGIPGQSGDTAATAGAANTGSGGGGAWRKYNGDGTPGAGGSGIIMIRPHEEESV